MFKASEPFDGKFRRDLHEKGCLLCNLTGAIYLLQDQKQHDQTTWLLLNNSAFLELEP